MWPILEQLPSAAADEVQLAVRILRQRAGDAERPAGSMSFHGDVQTLEAHLESEPEQQAQGKDQIRIRETLEVDLESEPQQQALGEVAAGCSSP